MGDVYPFLRACVVLSAVVGGRAGARSMLVLLPRRQDAAGRPRRRRTEAGIFTRLLLPVLLSRITNQRHACHYRLSACTRGLLLAALGQKGRNVRWPFRSVKLRICTI